VRTGGVWPATIYYFNGEDSLDLTYEYEVRPNGATEARHYLSTAKGEVFAEYDIQTEPGKPNSQRTAYLHQDHLSSLVLLTQASGAVLERMAYDAWGMRKYTDGRPDPQGQLLQSPCNTAIISISEHTLVTNRPNCLSLSILYAAASRER